MQRAQVAGAACPVARHRPVSAHSRESPESSARWPTRTASPGADAATRDVPLDRGRENGIDARGHGVSSDVGSSASTRSGRGSVIDNFGSGMLPQRLNLESAQGGRAFTVSRSTLPLQICHLTQTHNRVLSLHMESRQAQQRHILHRRHRWTCAAHLIFLVQATVTRAVDYWPIIQGRRASGRTTLLSLSSSARGWWRNCSASCDDFGRRRSLCQPLPRSLDRATTKLQKAMSHCS